MRVRSVPIKVQLPELEDARTQSLRIAELREYQNSELRHEIQDGAGYGGLETAFSARVRKWDKSPQKRK
jgi:hypothetical protein